MSNVAELPLAGLKVLDLSRVLAGPWCAQVLGDFGADVIKVEHPERGDDTRDWGAQVGDATAYFNALNRNKHSIALDLANESDAATVRRLATEADVLIHNFKTGGAEKLGIGYAELSALNPRLIHCSIAGYSSDTAEAYRPGYDLVIQAEAGLMAINGTADQPPLKFGVAIVDLFTGQFAAQAILAALVQRGMSGKGRKIELSLYDCGLSILSYYGLEALAAGGDPPRYGNAHPSIVPYGVFEAADGPIVITVGNNAQFDRFCRHVIARPDLADDPRFRTNKARSENRVALSAIVHAEIRKRTRAALMAPLQAAGIPCGEVRGLHEALTSERTRAAGMVIMGASRQSPAVLAPPYRMNGGRLPVRHMPPALGAHQHDILQHGFAGASKHAGRKCTSET